MIHKAMPDTEGGPIMTTITHREIREALGHNGVECRVRISRDGRVSRYGSPDPTDRSQDYWQEWGTVDDWRRSKEIITANGGARLWLVV